VNATSWFLVFLGGGIGSIGRFAMTRAIGLWGVAQFPGGTLLVNVGGSFAMGLCAALLPLATAVAPSSQRLFFITGVLGGFTTFSAFSLETIQLIERGEIPLALLYVLISVVLSLAGLMLGLWLGRSF
jgi:fluoride exporter